MKRVTIETGNMGMVFKNNALVDVLSEGNYWLFPNRECLKMDMSKAILTNMPYQLLLKNEKFVSITHVVTVNEQELCAVYENGLFTRLLKAGVYLFWKGLIDYRFEILDISKVEIDEQVDEKLLVRPELSMYIRTFYVPSNEKAVLWINGKFIKFLDPGTYRFWRNEIPVSVIGVDLRTRQMEISGQEILTKDKAAIRVNFYVQYAVNSIEEALIKNSDYEKQLYILLQLVLREFLGSLTLDELLDRKADVSEYILKSAAERSASLGVDLKLCGIRDIILPGEVKEILNKVLIAEKKAQANYIMRREETASTRNLLNTAKLMEENAMLLKLKEMEYVEKIAEKINTISLTGGTQITEQLRTLFSPINQK